MTDTPKPTIFITGGTGFIGAHLVQSLHAEGYTLRCLVRETSDTTQLQKLGVPLITGDVNDREALMTGMQGCDWVIHLANLYAMWHPNPEEFNRVNVEGTRLVMECALQNKVKKVIYLSTVAVFGKPLRQPFDETDPPGAELFSRYAASKAAADRIAWKMAEEQGLPLVTLYPGIVLGIGDDKPSGQYIQDILRLRVPTPIYRQSTNTYTTVEDVVQAVQLAAIKDTIGKRYLIGKERLNGLDYVRLICEVSGAPMPPLRLPDWMVTLVGTMLGWLSDRFIFPPLWGLCPDACATLKNGFVFDGSLAEKELGLVYHPIRETLETACKAYRVQFKRKKG